MTVNRITREDIIRLKLKRKRTIRKIMFLSLFVVCLFAGGVWFGFRYFNKTYIPGKELSVEIDPVIGVGNIAKIDYTEISASTTTPVEGNKVDEPDLSQIDFQVPETSLPPVEEIKGNDWYDATKYEKVDMGPVDLSYFNSSVFVGDSRSEGLIFYSGLPNLNGFCYKGLSVDKLDSEQNIYVEGYDGKYTCYQAVSMVPYNSYYLMFGVNELGWQYVDIFIEKFSALIDHVRTVNPDATIYVQSILPVSKSASDESDIYKQERINEFNDKIIQMCKDRGDVIYLDIASAVMGEDGYLPEEASPDGIHCNSDYCKRIIQYIRCNTYIKK